LAKRGCAIRKVSIVGLGRIAFRSFYEFFAGAGMARAGPGAGWTCDFANEFDAKKAVIYNSNWPGDAVLKVEDVAKLGVSDLPNEADWFGHLFLVGTYRSLALARD